MSKPLGSVEFIPAPYVTENTRVSIILPVQETEVIQSMNFLSRYDDTIMEKKEKTFLFIVFLYQYNSKSKGKVRMNTLQIDPNLDMQRFL